MKKTPGSDALPARLPVMPLRSTIVYPLGVIGVQIGMPTTLEMLAAHPGDNLVLALVVAPGGPDEPIIARELDKIGVAARLTDRLNMPGSTVQGTVQGIRRIRLSDIDESAGYLTAAVSAVEEIPAPLDVAQDLIARILTALEALASEVDRISREVPRILRMNVADPGRFADLVANLANFSVNSKDEVLQILDVEKRLTFIVDELEQQLRRFHQVARAEAQPHQPQQSEDTTPAEHADQIRQRIKRLQVELGDVDPVERESIDLFRRIEAADLPARVASQARQEVERLRSFASTAAEASEIRSYVDWLLNMPWRKRVAVPPAEMDLSAVEQELDAELLGLEEPKHRLLDYLAVAKLRGDLKGPIPCIVGPPDAGKTALAMALARGLGRVATKLDMGGRGEAQLVGARRTRSSANPGKLAGALRDAGCRDPVFVLEEMDEIGLGKVEGDPIEALEEILSGEGRDAFIDRYLDLPFDLSDAIFIATAQDFYRVPRDLREMMLEIRLAGYTPEEKVRIARDRMLPKLIAAHGLVEDDVAFNEEGLFFLARGYARDAGLGAMSRVLATLLRTRARAKAQGELGRWDFTSDRMEELLGLPRYVATPAESAPEVGVVTGLAWTASGGELMFIEALKMPGTGRLIITGMLGDVMRESVSAAFSYVRSRGDALSIPESSFKEFDVHVHFPVGAIPKDGPSAGIAVTLAIASTLSHRPVRHDTAMTGEVTLRGKVLEVGGVKEKVLAAYRAGIRRVILPRGNERDLREVPRDVRDNMSFEFVQRMDDVVRTALLPSGGAELNWSGLRVSLENTSQPGQDAPQPDSKLDPDEQSESPRRRKRAAREGRQ
jgi:ATP-dependent Lon protease